MQRENTLAISYWQKQQKCSKTNRNGIQNVSLGLFKKIWMLDLPFLSFGCCWSPYTRGGDLKKKGKKIVVL